MADLFRHQRFGNHADDFAAGSQRGIRQYSHQPNISGAIDDFDAAVCKQSAEFDCGSAIGRVVSRIGTAEDANSLEVHVGSADASVRLISLAESTSFRSPRNSDYVVDKLNRLIIFII